MCVTPSNLDTHGLVSCRNCWRCKKNRINDLVGRSIAESHTCKETIALTLTYAGDVPEAAVLTYPDFQNLMKRLRFAGYNVRYIVAGEYGSKKGRAHWHAILFFQDRAPVIRQPCGNKICQRQGCQDQCGRKPDELVMETRSNWSHWGKGYVFPQKPDYGGFAYVLKYIHKDLEAEVSTGHLAMSKKPPLGHDYFMALAEQYAAQNLSPQNPSYTFRDQFDTKGKRRKFWLQGRMKELFLDRYLEIVGENYPVSEFVQDYEDKLVRLARVLTDEEWRARLEDKIIPAKPRSADAYTEDDEPIYAEAYLTLAEPTSIHLTRFSDGSTEISTKEFEPWRETESAKVTHYLGWLKVPFREIEAVQNWLVQTQPKPSAKNGAKPYTLKEKTPLPYPNGPQKRKPRRLQA